MRRVRDLSIVLALLAVVSLVSYRIGVNEGGRSGGAPFNMSVMNRVKSKLTELYLDKEALDDKRMMYGAVEGMVAALDDPYTVFLPPQENKSANEDLAGEFGGVGISLGYKDKNLAVMTPLPKTPAERAGVLAGDLILKITDKNKNVERDTGGITLSEAVELIRGRPGSEVTLKLVREGKAEAFDVTLKRESIVVPSIELEWMEKQGKKVAWIKLYKFSDRLYTEWPEVAEQIKRESNRSDFGGMVLDLRNNPGGYLEASVLVASDFINQGVVVTQESSDGKKEVYEVDPKRRMLLAEKMVILVNGGSASAAEILAGALQDYNRGKLVGEKTFGKGTVQKPENFVDGSGLHVTIARWLLPNGKNIHKEGVTPEVEVKYERDEKDVKKDNQLDRAVEVLLSG